MIESNILLTYIYEYQIFTMQHVYTQKESFSFRLTYNSLLTNITIFIHVFEEHLRGSVHSDKLTRDTYHVMLIYCYLI